MAKQLRPRQLEQGLLVLVIGGSGGIGRAISTAFLRQGASVVIASDRQDSLDVALTELRAVSTHVSAYQCDVGDSTSVLALRDLVLSEHGCPDVLVNCAGFAHYHTFEESELRDIERLVDVNLTGAMRCASAFLPGMIARRSGHIVNVSSVAGRMVITPNATYCAAKHALVAWSEALQIELARFGVSVHVVCPGRVETGFFDHESFRRRARRPETRYTISSEAVASATLKAVRRNRFLTTIPWTLGALAWLLNALPLIFKPAYRHLLRQRVEELYAAPPLPDTSVIER